jgi:hypothetical protein
MKINIIKGSISRIPSDEKVNDSGRASGGSDRCRVAAENSAVMKLREIAVSRGLNKVITAEEWEKIAAILQEDNVLTRYLTPRQNEELTTMIAELFMHDTVLSLKLCNLMVRLRE